MGKKGRKKAEKEKEKKAEKEKEKEEELKEKETSTLVVTSSDGFSSKLVGPIRERCEAFKGEKNLILPMTDHVLSLVNHYADNEAMKPGSEKEHHLKEFYEKLNPNFENCWNLLWGAYGVNYPGLFNVMKEKLAKMLATKETEGEVLSLISFLDDAISVAILQKVDTCATTRIENCVKLGLGPIGYRTLDEIKTFKSMGDEEKLALDKLTDMLEKGRSNRFIPIQSDPDSELWFLNDTHLHQRSISLLSWEEAHTS